MPVTEKFDLITKEWLSPDAWYALQASRLDPDDDKRSDLGFPNIQGDLPEYASPIDGRPISGRVARKEDLKRSGCREVDPSEFTPSYNNGKTADKYGAKP